MMNGSGGGFDPANSMDQTPPIKGKGLAIAQNLGLPVEDLFSTFDPFKRSSNRLMNKLHSSI